MNSELINFSQTLLGWYSLEEMPSLGARSQSASCLLPAASHGEQQLREGLFWNTSDWWQDNGCIKVTSPPSHLSESRWKEPLWSNDHVKPPWLGSHVPSPHLQQSSHKEWHISSFCEALSAGDELVAMCEDGQLNRALDCMDQLGTIFSNDMYLTIMKACIKRKALTQAKRVHAHLVLHKSELTCLLGEHLVLTLAKCGGLDDALHIFNGLSHHTVFSWTAMISGFTDYGRAHEAINMHRYMQEEGVEPDRFTFISLFKACGCIAELEQGKKLHVEARRKGFASNVFVGNTLVSMYGKCGAIAEAESVFGGLTHHSVVSWTAMISAYVENNQGEKALRLYRQMQADGVSPNNQTFVCILQACGILAEVEDTHAVEGQFTKVMSLEFGQALHVDAWRAGFSLDVYVITTLISMYGNCGAIVEAETVFSKLSRHNVASWTAMLSAYVKQGEGEKALLLYRQMQEQGMSPNEHTLVCAIQTCDALANKEEGIVVGGQAIKARFLEIGRALHADALSKGFASGAFLGNVLVSMYGKHGIIKEAENVFAGLSQRTVVSWTSMLSAYVGQGQAKRALQSYREMHEEGVHPNQQTLVIAIQACGTLAENKEAMGVEQEQSTKSVSLKICQSLHADAQRMGFASDVFVGTTLVSIYGKCGAISQAEEVFCSLSQCNTVSWNAMISALVEQGKGEKALQLYKHMQKERVGLDYITLISVLQACSETGSIGICRQLHFNIVSNGHDLYSSIASSLIHAYGRCASTADAEAIYGGLPQPDVVSCNACIASYAGEGNCDASLQIFKEMLLASFKPDAGTFAPLLSACNHAGIVNEGIEYFQCMRKDYGITPDLKHYVSVVDLLGRAGDFKRLENMLWRLPMQADLALWLCLLGACSKHGNVELGKLAFDNAVNLQPKKVAAYCFMSNICAVVELED